MRVPINDKFFLILCCSSSSFFPYPRQNNNDDNGNNTDNTPCFECLPAVRHSAKHFICILLTLSHRCLATPSEEGIIFMGEETQARESQEAGSIMHSLGHCGLCLLKRQPGGHGLYGCGMESGWFQLFSSVTSLSVPNSGDQTTA